MCFELGIERLVLTKNISLRVRVLCPTQFLPSQTRKTVWWLDAPACFVAVPCEHALAASGLNQHRTIKSHC